METLTPSANTPTDPQVGKLHERLLSVARKSGISSQRFQIALAYPGTELEEELLAVIVRFAKKANGTITPVRAEDTSLVPNGWSVDVKNGVRCDSLEGDINLANLDYSFGSVLEGDGGYVNGDTMLARAGNAYGSLGFAAALLKAQKEGKEIFPVESRGKHYFIMPRTILLDDFRRRLVASFDWSGERWVLHFYWLGDSFHGRGRFVRPRELPLAA